MEGRPEHRSALRFLPLVAIIAGLVAAVVAERNIELQRDLLRAGLVNYRLQIESITGIRRDMRKTYVAVLENSVGSLSRGDGYVEEARHSVEVVSQAARAFARKIGSTSEEQTQGVHLVRAFSTWGDDTQAALSATTSLGLSKVKADVAEIDRVTESILTWNSAAARKADIATAAREVTRQWLRAAILVAVLALLASFLVWRVREVTHARLASAVKARRHQEELNTKLEKLVAARTHELAQSIDQLRESQSQLIQTGKMVAVGQLAAGIAHEINTPIQFVGDSVSFIHSAVRDMLRLLDCYAAWIKSAQTNGPTMAVEIARAEEEADLPYLVENLPKAIDRSLEGLDRVSTIVRSMKEFAHPEQREMTTVDLNHALESTLIIARSEYKYVADVTTDLGDLPQVLCYAGELNQVFLNILVNAAHAIASKVKDTKERGTITVRTRREGTSVVVSIGDTGTGIPRKIWERVFDPFFTTKEVGKGTGQGLAIAHSVVVDKHGGQLTFESEEGKGTTFCIRLPIQGKGEENEKEPQGAL